MRLKQAKDDAIAEITILREEKEKEFNEFESKVYTFYVIYLIYKYVFSVIFFRKIIGI